MYLSQVLLDDVLCAVVVFIDVALSAYLANWCFYSFP